MGNYDSWKTREPEPVWPRDYHTHDAPVICRDCGVEIREGGATTGIGSGASCGGCFAVRVDHEAVFDVRTLREIRQALREVRHLARRQTGSAA